VHADDKERMEMRKESTNADWDKHQGDSRSNQHRWHGIWGRVEGGGGESMQRGIVEDVV